MARIEQLSDPDASVLGNRVFLRVVGVKGSFDALCERFQIVPTDGWDEMGQYRYATLGVDGEFVQVEQYANEKIGFAILLLSKNPNVRDVARMVLKDLGLDEAVYGFIDQGYHLYP